MLTRTELKQSWSYLAQFAVVKTHAHTIKLFRAMVSLWVIMGTVILLPAADRFYSMNSHIPHVDVSHVTGWLLGLNILNLPQYNSLYPFFIAGQLIAAVAAGLSVAPRFSSLALYFFTINLDNRANVILDGGNNLMHLILIYLIFMTPHRHSGDEKNMSTLKMFDTLASNGGLLLCRLQVAVVYLTAGLLKVTGPLWTKGVALYYTMNVMEYGLPSVAELFARYPLILVGATYGTVLFQITFPVMIWLRRTRPLYMAIGTLLHLQISLVMGLFAFGLAMCTSHFAIHTDPQAARVLTKVSSATAFFGKNLKRFLIFAGQIFLGLTKTVCLRMQTNQPPNKGK